LIHFLLSILPSPGTAAAATTTRLPARLLAHTGTNSSVLYSLLPPQQKIV
jgi:hypothetical protein